MHAAIGRRAILHGAGCAACTAALGRLWPAISTAQAQSAYEQLDGSRALRLADLALDRARSAGATHADLRIARYRWQNLRARDRRIEESLTGTSLGFGLRVVVDGAWGFAGNAVVDEAAIEQAIDAAVENARAMRRLGAIPVVIESLPAHQDRWSMPMRIDPFAVDDSEKIDLLLAVNESALTAGATHVTAYLNAVKEEKFFANSVGSRIDQMRVRIAPGFTATVTNPSTGRFASRSSFAAPRAAGWEYVRDLGLDREAAEAAPQAREKLRARRVAPGRYDLVIHPTNLWLTFHESVGHSTELDRALGWETNFAGTSFVTPDQRGQLRYGSPLMTVLADRTQDGGLSSIGYDDDGVRTADAGFAIIEDGVFKNYQMAIGQAHLIGEPRSNGCAYADGPQSFPLQRMPNISLQPNPRPSSLDDLIGGVDNGIYILGDGSYSIDQQRHNFQFGGQLFYEIKNGKLGPMLTQVAYQGQTRAFWNAMDGLGDRSTYHLGGTFNCGKGEPAQSAPVSHGVVPARFRQVDVLNTARDDI